MSVGSATAAPVTSLPLSRVQDLVLPLGIIASVLVIMVPLPPALLDIMLSCNITAAIIILLTTIYVKTPLEFSVFPSLLLATTLARLVLNVATTRLILTRAPQDKDLAAGHVVKEFGNFVAGNDLVVGIIIFIIIVIIQFIVITKGATRISEVAARFALDGMPGRQMAIDADLNAGTIDENEAQRRRQDITKQADFFGAMDGASKFVRGDAIAGILITIINIIGGLVIGVVEGGMTIGGAMSVYTKLTIGDGLVSQVPAFLISLAAGLLTTRSSYETNLPKEFFGQLFSRPQALFVTAGFLGVLVFTNLPAVPLLSLSGGCIAIAMTLRRDKKQLVTATETKAAADAAKPAEERIEDYLATDPMEIEIGVGLIKLADPKRGGDLLERVQRVRQNVAGEIGIIMPKVRIRDNVRLDPNQYRIKIADIAVADGILEPHKLLAMNSGMATGTIGGLETRDPAFGTPALWIEPGQRSQAELYSYTVVEPASVLATHLNETVRKHADEILTRDSTKHLVDELKKTQPATVDELIPGQMKLAEVQRILQMLLREQVSIKLLSPILETLGDYAARTKDPVLLTEYVRHRLARPICSRYRDRENKLFVLTLDPAVEDRIKAGIEHNDRGLNVRMSPPAIEATNRAIAKELDKLLRQNKPPILLVSPQIRAGLKQITATQLPRLVVLSFNEITRDTVIESVGMVVDGK